MAENDPVDPKPKDPPPPPPEEESKVALKKPKKGKK